MDPDVIRLTYADYALIPEDGRRHEVIGGDEAVSPAPSTWHQLVVVRLVTRLQRHAEQAGGLVLVAPTDVLLSPYDIVQPDVLFVSDARAGIVRHRGVEGAPDLVAEVLSEGNRRHDEVRKRLLYGRSGVPEYWIVDPELATVRVLVLEGEAYAQAADLREGDVLTSPALPGFALPLEDLFP